MDPILLETIQMDYELMETFSTGWLAVLAEKHGVTEEQLIENLNF